MSMMAGGLPPSGSAKSGPARLTGTLTAAGAVAGLLIVLVYTFSTPTIEANRAATADAAIHDVLRGIERYDTLRVENGALVPAPKDEGTHGSAEAEKVYAGYDASGKLIGFAIAAREPGFQEPIDILVGYDPRTRTTLGLAILASRETPGLGDKIQESGWREQFRTKKTPVQGQKRGAPAPDTVNMVTGATISSRAVIGAINKSIEKWSPLLDGYLAGGRS